MRILAFVLLLFTGLCRAQNPDAQFSINAVACIHENLAVNNTSANSVRFEWDVCQGDLALTPTAVNFGSVPSPNIPTGIDVVYDGTTWFGFVTNRNANAIVRMALGVNLTSTPVSVNLGNVSSLLNAPTDIKIVGDNGNWYGFVYNEGSNAIVRLDFGSSLTNAPTATVVVTTAGNTNQGLEVVRSGSTWYVLYTLNTAVTVVRLASITTIPTGADIKTTVVAASVTLGDITVLEQNGSFFAYTAEFPNRKLYRVAYGSDLFNTPTVADLSASLPADALLYYGIDGAYDAGYRLLFATLGGAMVRVDLGHDLTQTPTGSQVIGTLGVVFNTVKNKLVKHQSSWFNFAVDYVNGTLFKVTFPTPACQLAPGLFTQPTPSFQFLTAGTKHISLRSFSAQGTFDDDYKSVSISSLESPSLDFSNQKICLQSAIPFQYTSSQTLMSQLWEFGDSQTSTLPSPEHTYASVGNYSVKLSGVAANGCQNQVAKTVTIYDQPVASFTLPSGLICTNNEFTFANTTTDNFDGNLVYNWKVNGNSVSAQRDLKYTFTSSGDFDILLNTSIPGCQSEQAQTISNVQAGPQVDFAISGRCVGEVVTFTNQSVGSIAGYNWNLGNSNQSTDVNTTQVYAAVGLYNITLQTTGTNGCVSTLQKPLTIYSKPQPDFSVELPPFSCAGSPSQFNDLTPAPVDSNIETWAWTFGDAASGTSTLQNPLYTYATAATYNVRLITTTEFGCVAEVQKQVTISPSPSAEFSFEAACANKPTRFTPGSGADVKTYLWTTGTTTYSLPSPTHVYALPGSYTMTLRVTSNNNCVSSVTRNVMVPEPPALAFATQNLCATQSTLFVDTTPPAADATVTRTWDFGDQRAGTGVSPSHTYSAEGSFPVRLEVTQQSGCKYALVKNVTINPTPKAAFQPSADSGPAPLTVQFTNTSRGASSYLWTFSDPAIGNSTAAAPTATFNSLGQYAVDLRATSDKGCSDLTSKLISVVVPRTNVTLQRLELIPNQNGALQSVLTILNNSNYALSGIEVVLDFGLGLALREIIPENIGAGQTLTYALAYQLMPRDQSFRYVCTELVVPADDEASDNRQCLPVSAEIVTFAPYPNPASNSLSLQWITVGDEAIELTLTNAQGATAYRKTFELRGRGLHLVTADITALPSGLYIAQVNTGTVQQRTRLVVR